MSSDWLDANGYDHVSNDKRMVIFSVSDQGSDLSGKIENCDRLIKLITGIASQSDKAINSALHRAVSAGKTIASQSVREEYDVSASGFGKNTKSSEHINRGSDGIGIAIKYAGYHIPLAEFKTQKGISGVYARVNKKNTRSIFKHAFYAHFGSSTCKPGIYERNTKKRFPIHQLWGPSAAQMMWSNTKVKRMVDNRVKEVFEQRLDHEMLAIMNGWRR